ncbi:hypothetical protein [Streptomyces sp. NPDC016675]|uniref:hypothetical protein n=1 Tax=Streptomyces sp. NPDC016675 TaxID=3364970 RepID=UPI0036F7FB38
MREVLPAQRKINERDHGMGRMRTEMFMIHEGPSYSSSVTARFDGEYVVIDSNAGLGYDPDKVGAGSTTTITKDRYCRSRH